jgi:4-amino-4-deoxy-L-arabinose transferase-like glycosyltransferase
MTTIAGVKSATAKATDVAAGFAAAKLALHLPVLTRYGYHHDELYFLACGRHLALGYVDHPPIVPWLARLADALFPHSLLALRLLPAMAGALAVLLAGLLARRLGGGRFAQTLACLGMIVAPVYLRTGNMLSIPSFEPLVWLGVAYLVSCIVDEDQPRLWPVVGLVIGVGLLLKHSTLFLAFGLLLALAVAGPRKHLRSPWLWAGAGLTLLVFSPNLAWQAAHGWPTVEFLRRLNQGTMAQVTALQFVAGQLFYLHPITAPLWIAGLVFYLRGRAGASGRVFAWIFIAVFALLLLIKSKIYYLAPAYPTLLVGGGLAFEAWGALVRRTWLRPAIVGVLAVLGTATLPMTLPLMSIDRTDAYISAITLGAFPNVYEPTGDLRGQFGWKQRAEIVAGVYHSLRPEERSQAVILAGSYGVAAAIDYFGAALGLPSAYSPHLSYHLWGPPPSPTHAVVAAGIRAEDLAALFEEVTVAAEVDIPNVNPWERRFTVLICRRPTVDRRALWPRMRRW